jgi:hypothetical protein
MSKTARSRIIVPSATSRRRISSPVPKRNSSSLLHLILQAHWTQTSPSLSSAGSSPKTASLRQISPFDPDFSPFAAVFRRSMYFTFSILLYALRAPVKLQRTSRNAPASSKTPTRLSHSLLFHIFVALYFQSLADSGVGVGGCGAPIPAIQSSVSGLISGHFLSPVDATPSVRNN